MPDSPRRYAILAGLDDCGVAGLGSATDLRADLLRLNQLLRRDPGATHQIMSIDLFDTRDTVTAGRLIETIENRFDTGPDQHLWVALGGDLVYRHDDVYLVTGDSQPQAPGLSMRTLGSLLGAIPCQRLVVLLDLNRAAMTGPLPRFWRRAEVRAVSTLDAAAWTLLLAGPGVIARVSEVLETQVGDVTAGDLIAGSGGAEVASAADASAVIAVAPKRAAAVDPDAHFKDLQARQYLQKVKSDSRFLAFERRDASRAEPELSTVYVHGYASDPDAELSARDKGKSAAGREVEEPPRPTLAALLSKHPRLLIQGKPGSGKTTFLRKLAADAADATLADTAPPAGLPQRPLPILVRLEEYGKDCQRRAVAPSATDLRDYAFSRLIRAESLEVVDPTIAKEALRDHRVVFLLDGLDEVPSNDLRATVAAAIGELARACPELVVLVTCRPAAIQGGVHPGSLFPLTTLHDFDDHQRQTFIRGWLGRHAHSHEEADTATAALLADLATNSRLVEESRNPLTLTVICTLFRERGRLPDDRAKLYEEITDLLLRDRDAKRWTGASATLDQSARFRALIALAWAHRTATPTRPDATRTLLSAATASAVLVDKEKLAPEVAADFVAFLHDRTSLLDWRATENGERFYDFPHRTVFRPSGFDP